MLDTTWVSNWNKNQIALDNVVWLRGQEKATCLFFLQLARHLCKIALLESTYTTESVQAKRHDRRSFTKLSLSVSFQSYYIYTLLWMSFFASGHRVVILFCMLWLMCSGKLWIAKNWNIMFDVEEHELRESRRNQDWDHGACWRCHSETSEVRSHNSLSWNIEEVLDNWKYCGDCLR